MGVNHYLDDWAPVWKHLVVVFGTLDDYEAMRAIDGLVDRELIELETAWTLYRGIVLRIVATQPRIAD